MELNNLPDKELKAIVIKMLTKLRKIIEKHWGFRKYINLYPICISEKDLRILFISYPGLLISSNDFT